MENTGKKMNVMQLTLLTAMNMLGSGIIMLPSKLAQVGTMSIISWLVTATGSLCLAYVFAKCGMFSKKQGGMGGYAEYAFGKIGNFVANYTYAISTLIATVATAVTAVGYATQCMDVVISPVKVCLCTIVLLWFTTVLNFGGARITGRIGSFTILGVILPVGFMSFFGWFWFSPDLYFNSWNPNSFPIFKGVSMSISMTLWAFLGLESACVNADVVENPEKNIPIAVLFGTLGAAVIYILSTNVIAGIVPNLDLAASNAPFGLAFSTMLGGTVGKVVMAMMVVSCIGSLISWKFALAQVFKSAAAVGHFPAVFRKVTRKEVPIIGMVIITFIQSILAFMTISPSLYTQFNILVDLAVVINMVPYILSMVAVRNIQNTVNLKAKQKHFTNFLAVLGTIYSVYAIYSTGTVAMVSGLAVTVSGLLIYIKIIMPAEYEKNLAIAEK